ncbi:PaaI family thioesterase [Falsibacillus pallidus]|uniref:Acyl-CoA thioesterase n=1 Tax=Falsibacillus pallidus TaxID=493781 RepID=A0A370GWY6_9BACI|nr:hotdog fold thioesterase [Falsibacillus pallidus]RDI47989.1 acyl-CoA thioesterase [Falsibacillus pallidus]
MKQLGDSERHHQYKEEIFSVFEKEPYASSMGIRLVEIGEGSSVAELKTADHMVNSHGTIHGAVIFALADFAFAAACNSYGRTCVGLSTTVNFMSAGQKGAVLRAEAVEEKKNYRTAWYNIKVFSGDELIASMEAMAYRKDHYFVP